MILAADAAARQAFLEQYRRRASLDESLLTAEDRRLFATAGQDRFPGAVLPGPPALGTERQRLYAVADSGAQWRQLAPLLRAAVGVTITEFVGRTTMLDSACPFEAWLSEHELYVGRIAAGPGIGDDVPGVLVRALVRTIERSESPGRGLPRSTDDVLEALSLALAAGQRDAAHAEIEFLRSNWRMDALNLRFLEVRVDAELRDWPTLRARTFFDDLCRTRRPVPVTVALLEAIYHTSIGSVERNHGPEAALDIFKRTVNGRVGTLLEVPPANPTRPVATLFALAALSTELPNRQALALLDETAGRWDEAEQTAFRALVDTLTPAAPVPPVPAEAGASSAIEYPTSPRTFSWAATLVELRALQDDPAPPTVDRARSAILGAVELNGFEASRLALTYVARLSAPDRDALLGSRVIAAHWETLQRNTAEGRAPANWLEWISLLPDVPAETARTWAERAVVEWPLGEHLRSARDAAALADAFERVGAGDDAASARQIERRRDAALVDLFRWLHHDPAWPNPEYLELYGRLQYLLALSPNRSPATLEVLTELLRGMLQIGLTPPAYEDALHLLVDIVRDLDSASFIDQLIDLIEATAEAPCPIPAVRRELWELVMGIVLQYVSHLTSEHRAVLEDLARLLDVRAELQSALADGLEQTQPMSVPVPEGYEIGVYTLMESIGNRVKVCLERTFPGVLVEVNASRVSTDGLTSLARRADLFVLGWRSAKHAATDAITAARPGTLPTIFPAGKGSSSMLASVRAFLLAQRSA